LTIALTTFLNLPVEEVAHLVRESGLKVVVFPINGTRRWFTLEHGQKAGDDPISAYLDIASKNHINLYRLFFDLGIDTLLTPAFGPDLLLRGDEYVKRIGAGGLARLASHPTFLNFYEEFDVRIFFYGDHRRSLSQTEYAYLSDLFDEAAEKTKHHDRYRLFFGVFAQDATQTIAELSVDYYSKYSKVPDKRTLIELYYGEYVEPVDIFIGFDKFSVFDMPLLATGDEDLYFTVSPSPYVTEHQLRRILFDHLYTRRAPEPDFFNFTAEAGNKLRQYYLEHQEDTLGIGALYYGVWIPELGSIKGTST
jgi:tuberculosinol/isotuberculosinol synthase